MQKHLKKAGVLFLLIMGLLYPFSNGYAQVKSFGDVEVSDFEAYNPEYDSTMSAVILFKKGNIFSVGGKILQQNHTRIKIINDVGFDYSNVKIPVLRVIDQKVSDLKAASYNLNESKEIEVNSLDKDQIMKEKYSDRLEIVSFAIPDVHPGSIIEYSFTQELGGLYSLPDWKFHDYVPVEWSEVEMHIPTTVQYKVVLTGDDKLEIQEVETGRFRGEKSINYHLAKSNLPAIEDLPFIINRDDYVATVRTQLMSTWYSQSSLKDWDDITRVLMMSDSFGHQRLTRKMKAKVKEIVGEESDPLKICELLYSYMVNNVEWNGHYGIFSDVGIKDAFDTGEGSAADINLLLSKMLQEAGVKASPALISTRDNGNVLTDTPLIEQFNMTIVVAEIGESAFSIDASSGKRSIYSPHPETLYRQAFVVKSDKDFGWLTTQPVEKTSERVQVKLSLGEESNVHVNVAGVAQGMYAEDIRSSVEDVETHEEYWEDVLENYTSVTVDTASFENLDALATRVDYSAQFIFNAQEDVINQGEIIYVRPFTYLKTDTNPFIKQTRNLPVEYYYPVNKSMMIELEIPDGYVVEEVPQSTTSKLPLENAYYRFQASQNGNKILLMSQLVLKGVLYVPEEYPYLKDMYQTMVNTQTATVVFKKVEDSE